MSDRGTSGVRSTPDTAGRGERKRPGHATPPAGSFLAHLSAVERDALWRAGTQRRFRAGGALLSASEVGQHVAVLIAGRVKVATASADGHEAMLGIRGPGDLVGEQAMAEPVPHGSCITALEPVEVLMVKVERFATLLASQPRAAVALSRMLVLRLREADADRLEFGACTVRERLARFLLRLCDGHGRDHGDAIVVTVPLSQRDLAAATGSSREAVVKALRDLRGRGVVTTERRRITVRHPAALRVLAGYR